MSSLCTLDIDPGWPWFASSKMSVLKVESTASPEIDSGLYIAENHKRQVSNCMACMPNLKMSKEHENRLHGIHKTRREAKVS